jgi:hypothetical protein
MPGESGSDAAWRAGMAMLPLTAPTLIIPLFAARFARRMAPRTWLGGGLLIAAIGAVGNAAVLLRERSASRIGLVDRRTRPYGRGLRVFQRPPDKRRDGRDSTRSGRRRVRHELPGAAGGGSARRCRCGTSLCAGRGDEQRPRGRGRLHRGSAVALVGAAAAWNLGPRCWPNDSDPESRSSPVGVWNECAAPIGIGIAAA